jgi:FkbM family methyltransferase
MDRRVSFAQMAEDIVLWRALGHRPAGFYVDVGAHHPVGSSVTKIFYNQGWRGINIEPIAPLLDLFLEDRPRDINLAVGVSVQPGQLNFFDVEADQQRSTFDEALAAMYRAEGRSVVTRTVPVVPLDQIFAEHVDCEVDFLKIDAEGHEESVIRSLDWGRWRPHVVLAEGALHRADQWPQLLLDASYRTALFDGVNRFFIAEEHWDELHEALSYPACPLDNFDTYDHLLLLNSLQAEIDRLTVANADLRDQIESSKSQNEYASSDLLSRFRQRAKRSVVAPSVGSDPAGQA